MLAFNLGGGAVGIWWGLALGLACAAVGLTLAFEGRMKRMMGGRASSLVAKQEIA
ncbi:multidrug efflux protein NorA [compost metagenome]